MVTGPALQPFASAEAAWLWMMRALTARHDDAMPGPCEPDEVLRALARLYRQRRIGAEHLTVLRRYGHERQPPPVHKPADVRLWKEAMARLEPLLRERGIVE